MPRSTNDIDIVIAPAREQLSTFLEQFPPAAYAKDTDDAFDALRHRTQFSVIDYATMWKVDLILRQHTPFDASPRDARSLKSPAYGFRRPAQKTF